jgi:hypothetical protein
MHKTAVNSRERVWRCGVANGMPDGGWIQKDEEADAKSRSPPGMTTRKATATTKNEKTTTEAKLLLG